MSQLFRAPRSLVTLLVLLAASIGFSGCTSVEVSPGILGEYRIGELQVIVEHDFATVYNATKSAAKDVGLFQTQDDRKTIEADLHFRDSADTLVIVKIKEVATRRTSIKIRYSFQGNLSQSQQVFQAIRKRY